MISNLSLGSRHRARAHLIIKFQFDHLFGMHF